MLADLEQKHRLKTDNVLQNLINGCIVGWESMAGLGALEEAPWLQLVYVQMLLLMPFLQ